MPMHLVAWYENVDPGGSDTPISAVQDPTLTTQGDIIRVPQSATYLMGVLASIASSGPNYAELRSPSMRQVANQSIHPLVTGIPSTGLQRFMDLRAHPRRLQPSEDVSFVVNASGGAGADHYGFMMLGSGPVTPAQGDMFTVRASSAISAAAGTWEDGNLTIEPELPVGTYDVVGFRAEASGLGAARLIFPDQWARPGVPAVASNTDATEAAFRFGNSGSFGRFHTTTPPSVEVIGGTSSAQSYVLDLVRSG